MRPMEGPFSADSEEKRAPVSDINTALVDRLKALDPNRPIREADISHAGVASAGIGLALVVGMGASMSAIAHRCEFSSIPWARHLLRSSRHRQGAQCR